MDSIRFWVSYFLGWVWAIFYFVIFSDPNEPTGVIQQFCVRFKNAEIAGTFKTAFEECQNKLLDAPGFTPGREVRILAFQ